MNREFVGGLAVEAGHLLVRHLGARVVRVKFGTDIVTEADEAAERFIREEVRRHFPGHRVVGEEYGSTEGDGEWEWVVDPLDGTQNFARGSTYFSVSIALLHAGEVQIGAVYRPLTHELFLAERGGGATRNGETLSVSETARVEESVMVLDWSRRTVRRETFARMQDLFYAAGKVRSFGSAALDLCGVAAGQLDAFVHPGLSPWDFAAGHLILQEAGGAITTLEGAQRTIEAGSVVATNGHIHRELLSLLTAPPA